MAQRRMFNLKVVDTDEFLDMSLSTQALYFHLAMRADDDGFVSNAKKIMRMISSQEDELKVLFSKQFIIPFKNGICVIKHWRIHNYLRSDRYQETQYLEEKKQLNQAENGEYELVDTAGIPVGYQRETQVRIGKDRKGKDRIGKDRKETDSSSVSSNYTKDFLSFWEVYPRKVGKGEAFKAWEKAKLPSLTSLTKAVKTQKQTEQWQKENGRYIPNPATWLNQRRWEDELEVNSNNNYAKYDS